MPGAAQAWAALFNAASLAFAYPDEEWYGALRDGSLAGLLTDHLSSLPAGTAPADAARSLATAASDAVRAHDRRTLETEYVALFEMNRDRPVLHPYAHLYDPRHRDQVQLLTQLAGIYAEFGLVIAPTPGREAPDHITVQLEFMSYLWMLLHQASGENARYSAGAVQDGLRRFHAELLWIPEFSSRVVRDSKHPLYVSLASYVSVLVETPPVTGSR